MKRISRGFTLAEVLVTLGIIGVIAILIMPALTIAVDSAKAETALSKAVNTLKNAHMHMALENESKDIVSNLEPETYLKKLSSQLQGGKFQQETFYVIDGMTTPGVFSLAIDDGITYICNGVYLTGAFVNANKTNDDYEKKFKGEAIALTIDVNGKKGPNLYGKDQFLFYVDGYGATMPYGGAEINNFNSIDGISSMTPQWRTDCPLDKNKVPKDTRTCAASLVENGYKIGYAYKSIVAKEWNS